MTDKQKIENMKKKFDPFISMHITTDDLQKGVEALNRGRAKKRLEYLRAELRAERISYGEIAELQGLVKFIDPSDVELLEAAGVPEGKEAV